MDQLAGLEVNVKDYHIERGVMSDCGKCPVALALYEAVSEATGIPMGEFFIYVDGLSAQIGFIDEYYVPDEVTSFIGDYDNSIAVKPFTFKLGHSMIVTQP